MAQKIAEAESEYYASHWFYGIYEVIIWSRENPLTPAEHFGMVPAAISGSHSQFVRGCRRRLEQGEWIGRGRGMDRGWKPRRTHIAPYK
jgi:hypothetical protein